MYVISPRLMVEEADATIERIQGLVQDAGGEILMTDNWGRRRLAYPIKHHFEGTYVLTHMTLPPDRVAGLERALNLNESILRHLVVRGLVPGYDGPPEEEVMYARRATSRAAPRTEEPRTEEPRAEEPRAEEPRAEEPRAEEPRTEAPPAEAPRAEAPPAEAPPPETAEEAVEAPAEAPAAAPAE